jgi:hypothetical protein
MRAWERLLELAEIIGLGVTVRERKERELRSVSCIVYFAFLF